MSEQEITEAEAYERARNAAAFDVGRDAVGYRWGWVFMPASSAFGPGPISVTKRGIVISHGSAPMTFDDDHEPTDRSVANGANAKKRSWWQALVEALSPGT